MADTARRQRDLFESPATPTSIPIHAQQQMLELLKELLTEAFTRGSFKADVDEEDGGDEDRS